MNTTPHYFLYSPSFRTWVPLCEARFLFFYSLFSLTPDRWEGHILACIVLHSTPQT